MKVKDLILKLQAVDQDADVYIPDSHYGEDGTMSKLETISEYREYTTQSYIELGFV